MAKKPPETVDRFRVNVEIAKEQLGEVVAALTKLGFEHVNHELITDVLGFKKRPLFEINGADFLRAWLEEHPTFTRKEVIAHFIQAGRTEPSASSSIQRLMTDKQIKALGDGNYQRRDIKAITGPKNGAKSQAAPKGISTKTGRPRLRKRNEKTNYETPNFEFLLARLRTRKSMTIKDLKQYFKANGRKPKSVGALLTNLVAMHKVRRIAQGVYAAVKIKKVKLTPPAKLNGAAQPATEAAANG